MVRTPPTLTRYEYIRRLILVELAENHNGRLGSDRCGWVAHVPMRTGEHIDAELAVWLSEAAADVRSEDKLSHPAAASEHK